MASLNNRLRPRLVVLRLRRFSLMFGIIPALKMHLRLRAESKPPSRLREAPLRSKPTSLATCFKACSPFGNRTISVSAPQLQAASFKQRRSSPQPGSSSPRAAPAAPAAGGQRRRGRVGRREKWLYFSYTSENDPASAQG